MYSNLLCMYICMYMFKENAIRLHHDNDVLMYVEEIYVLLRYDSCLFSIVHKCIWKTSSLLFFCKVVDYHGWGGSALDHEMQSSFIGKWTIKKTQFLCSKQT